MEYIIMWIGTIVVSMGIKVAVAFDLIKTIANCGFKIIPERFEMLNNLPGPLNENPKLKLMLDIVPICNLFMSMFVVVSYSNEKYKLVDSLKIMGAIEEMTEEELDTYNQKRTGLNAAVIAVNSNLKNKQDETNDGVIKITCNENSDNYTVSFKIDDDGKDITILSASGTIEELSLEEQKKKILETFMQVEQFGEQNYGSADAFHKELKEKYDINLDKKVKTINDLIEDKNKQELKDMKKNIESYLKEENIDDKKDEVKKYTKK